jgi:hypothetical protein
MNAREIIEEAKRLARVFWLFKIYKPWFYMFRYLPRCIWQRKRFEFHQGPYDFGLSCTDEYFGIRWRRTDGMGRYGLIGFSIDDGWYQPTVSYGFVFLGRWRGFFLPTN